MEICRGGLGSETIGRGVSCLAHEVSTWPVSWDDRTVQVGTIVRVTWNEFVARRARQSAVNESRPKVEEHACRTGKG